MHLNLLVEASPNPFFPGMWRSPEDDSSLGYRSIGFWRELIARAEAGGFDAVIFDPTDALPRLDPLMLMSALAASSTHIGLVAPLNPNEKSAARIAEQFSALDHIADGRMGIRLGHAEASMIKEAVARWETSWDDNAMVFSTRENQMIDPDRVRPVGDFGIHPSEPTRQRTPTLFGRADEATGPALAEVLMLNPMSLEAVAETIEMVYDQVDAADRSFDEVTLVMTARVIVGADELQVSQLKRQVNRYGGEGTAASVPFLGTAEQIADQMQGYLDAGIQGFSVATTPLPLGVDLLVQHLVPELQARQLLRTAYEASTLREHYLGYGQNHLAADHPARN